MKPTQADRLLIFLANNPGSTSLQITLATSVVNVTGRISDLRARGHVVECRKRSDGELGYFLVPKRVEASPPPFPATVDPETWLPRDFESSPPCVTCSHPKYHHHGERSRKRRCLYCSCQGYAVAPVAEPTAGVQEGLGW